MRQSKPLLSDLLKHYDPSELQRFEAWATRDVTQLPHTPHNFTMQLPPKATRFCTAYNDPTMEVMEPYTPTNDPLEIPNRTLHVTGCRQPIVVIPFQGVKMYPQLKCGALKPWRQILIDKVLDRNGGAGLAMPREWGVTAQPPQDVIQLCLEECLTSPCCLTFTLEQNHTSGFRCTLQYCDYTRAHYRQEAVEAFNGYSYVLAYRREYRPSLVRTDWRLAVHRGPDRVIRVKNVDEVTLWRSRPLVVRAVAEHGIVRQPVSGRISVRVSCGAPLTSPFGTRVSEEGGVVLIGEGHFEDGEAKISDLTRVRQDHNVDLFMWNECTGRRLSFVLNATLHAKDNTQLGEEGTPFPNGDPTLHLTYNFSALFHREAVTSKLLFTPRIAGAAATANESNDGSPPHTFDKSSETCAPLLREDECCLKYVWGRQLADWPATGTITSADGRLHLLDASHNGTALTSVILEARTVIKGSDDDSWTATGGLQCVRLVDGFATHFDEDGIVRFDNLVVWVNRTEACRGQQFHVELRATQRFDKEGAVPWMDAPVRLPVHWFMKSCGKVAKQSYRDLIDIAPDEAVKDAMVAEPLPDGAAPILLSVPAHECIECLHSLLRNLRTYVWPSIVVIHFPISIRINESALPDLNRSHPFTYVNRHHVDSVVGVRLLHIHGLNVHFALTDLAHIRFSHALFLASNEMFVRHGVVQYMRRYDAVWMKNPTADTGALFEHHGDGKHRWSIQEFHTMEDSMRLPPREWGFVWPDTIVADHWLGAAMRHRGLTKHPISTVLLEGTFFRYDLAKEFAELMMTMFDPFDYCEEPMLYPHCEILGPTAFQNVCERKGVRCGHRVTTMMWMREEWTSIEDDIRRVRCSPFEVPFGFKRIPRIMTNPVRRLIEQLDVDKLVRRDNNLTFCLR